MNFFLSKQKRNKKKEKKTSFIAFYQFKFISFLFMNLVKEENEEVELEIVSGEKNETAANNQQNTHREAVKHMHTCGAFLP